MRYQIIFTMVPILMGSMIICSTQPSIGQVEDSPLFRITLESAIDQLEGNFNNSPAADDGSTYTSKICPDATYPAITCNPSCNATDCDDCHQNAGLSISLSGLGAGLRFSYQKRMFLFLVDAGFVLHQDDFKPLTFNKVIWPVSFGLGRYFFIYDKSLDESTVFYMISGVSPIFRFEKPWLYATTAFIGMGLERRLRGRWTANLELHYNLPVFERHPQGDLRGFSFFLGIGRRFF